MSKLEIYQYSYMSDNYGVLLHDPENGETACIDCGDAQASLAALQKTGWSLTEIWVTHHHADHTAGVMELKSATGANVRGPAPLSQNIDGLDETLNDGDTFVFAGLQVHTIHTPGHTKDMINFYLPDENLLFTGDTLFTMGCGRLFECDASTNAALRSRASHIESLRADGKPTVPSTLQQELDTNPFLRTTDKNIRELLDMPSADDAEVFAEIRLRKDNF